MKYKITVAELLAPMNDSGYERESKLYEQVMHDVDLAKLVCFLNQTKAL